VKLRRRPRTAPAGERTARAGTTGPVFVLGAPQSGATALSWALSQHPALRALHGTGWMARLCLSLAAVEAEGRKVDRTRSTITAIGHLAQHSVGADRFWQSFGTGIDALMRAGGAGPTAPARTNGSAPGATPRWVSADPELDRVVHALDLLFPDARFLHVVRGPGGALAAMTTKGRSNPRPLRPAEAVSRWVEAVDNGLAAEAALGDAALRVEHGAMVSDPRATLTRCLDHLGLPWADGCLRPLRGGPSPTPAAAGVRLADLPASAVLTDVLARLASPRHPAGPGEVRAARERLIATLHRHAGLLDGADAAPEPVRRFRALLEACVPTGVTVAVVSRGDHALIDLPGIEAVHFPQTDGGTYAGHHPADSADAMARLDDLRARGTGYLALPRASFWWLDHYVGLREHLLRDGHVVGHHADVGLVFALEPAAVPGRQVLTFGYTDREAEAPVEPGHELPAPTGHEGTAARLGRTFARATDHLLVWEHDAPVAVPEGWPVRSVGRWHVAGHPCLPVRELQDRHGSRLGWILGVALAPGLGPGPGPARLDLTTADGPTELDAALYRFGGRWAAVIDAPWGTRLHLDAGGTLAMVHSPAQRVAASTTTLLQAVVGGPEDAPPATDEFPADRPNRFFPAGLTHLRWVQRLLPGHHLDLSSWEPRRHWPTSDIPVVDDVGLVAQLQRISTGLGSVLGGLAELGDVHLGLTAGRDSRLLLACGRAARDAISTFTFDYGPATPGSAVDLAVARELAALAGVRHQAIPVREPGEDEKAAYLGAIGYAGHWGKCADFGALGPHLRPSGTLAPGFLGGLGRGHYWTGMPRDLDALTPEVLLDRLRLPATAPFLEAMARWRSGLPEVDPRLALDLLYLEHRGGCWASPHLYGVPPLAAVVVPFAHRDVLDAMFRLPRPYRRKKRLFEDVVRVTWPELLELPYQALPGSPP
jgi:hypothetical protein